MAAAANTVLQAIIACGVSDTAVFGGETHAQRVAEGFFGNDFNQVVDKSKEDIVQNFKEFAELPANQ